MRLHLLLLLSVVYFSPAFCQTGGFPVFQPAYPTAFEILHKQAEAITTAFRNKDTALIASLIHDDVAGGINDLVKLLTTLSFRAVSASYVGGEVHGLMVLSLSGHPSENMKSRLIEDSGSPTGWVLVGLGPQAFRHHVNAHVIQYQEPW